MRDGSQFTAQMWEELLNEIGEEKERERIGFKHSSPEWYVPIIWVWGDSHRQALVCLPCPYRVLKSQHCVRRLLAARQLTSCLWHGNKPAAFMNPLTCTDKDDLGWPAAWGLCDCSQNPLTSPPKLVFILYIMQLPQRDCLSHVEPFQSAPFSPNHISCFCFYLLKLRLGV